MNAFVKHLLAAAAVLLLAGVLAVAVPALAGAQGDASPSPATAPAVTAAQTPHPAPTTADPVLTFLAIPGRVRSGHTVTFIVHLSVPGASLQLSRRHAGDPAFRPLRVVTADSGGRVSWSATLARTTQFRVEYAGDTTWSPATDDVTVNVAPRIGFRLVARRPFVKGHSVTARVKVGPAHPGSTVDLQLRDPKTKAWTLLKTLTLNSESRIRYSWKPSRIGRMVVRVHMAADADHVAGSSPTRYLRVLDPRNPYGVPTSAPRYIVVDRSQYRLYYHEYGQVIRVFNCVLGRPGLPTPLGHFRIYAKDAHMSGPYGPHRMRYKGLYAIHGTDEPWLLNRFPRNYSHGCTRLSNAHISWLFPRCRVGTPVWNVR